MNTIDELLATARARLQRLEPRQAAPAVARGALLVDIRPAASLQDIGLHRATDVVCGFDTWVAAGLPVTPPRGATL